MPLDCGLRPGVKQGTRLQQVNNGVSAEWLASTKNVKQPNKLLEPQDGQRLEATVTGATGTVDLVGATVGTGQRAPSP